ncbi:MULTISPECIES: ROK family protein [Streptomyces]|uniref:Kanosamine kinase n=1 Tax=Streptomyces canarius TaxID=285453 RepID=A0ABQ3CZU2_9ACTN|nr:ROK family protein [Streptomyces canarius]GHA46410.1 kanosamine kinase [Streptomyces canarius]
MSLPSSAAGSREPAAWLGMDIGGTKVALRAEIPGGRARERVVRWPGRGAAGDLARLAAEVALLHREVPGGFAAVGVALPATVGPDDRVVVWPSRPEWVGLDVRCAMAELFPDTPVGWADDGDLAALAEAEATGCADVLYVGVGTGVGGGLTCGGGPVPGLGRGSFELGHVVTDPDGPPCRCGRRGCLQSTASGPATLARAGRLHGADVTYRQLREAFAHQEQWAVRAVDRTCHRIALAVTGVRELMHPQLVVVGGGFAAGLPGFVDLVAHHLHALARPGVPAPPVRASCRGGLTSLYGAVALARVLEREPARTAALARRVPPG